MLRHKLNRNRSGKERMERDNPSAKQINNTQKQPRILYPAKFSFINENEIKNFQNKQNKKEIQTGKWKDKFIDLPGNAASFAYSVRCQLWVCHVLP